MFSSWTQPNHFIVKSCQYFHHEIDWMFLASNRSRISSWNRVNIFVVKSFRILTAQLFQSIHRHIVSRISSEIIPSLQPIYAIIASITIISFMHHFIGGPIVYQYAPDCGHVMHREQDQGNVEKFQLMNRENRLKWKCSSIFKQTQGALNASALCRTSVDRL